MAHRQHPGDAVNRPQPQRTCAACRQVAGKRGLVRLVRSPDGAVSIDERGKAAGRGTYLCRRQACWEQALRRHVLERALRIERLSDENRTMLEAFARQLTEPAADEAERDEDLVFRRKDGISQKG